MTRDKAGPALLELMPALTRFVPPATVFDRQTYCAFTNARLQAFLDEHQVDTVIVSGGETDVCVLATVLAAVDIGYRVILAEDALCSSSDESHDALVNLYTRRFILQIEVAPVASILANWSGDDSQPVKFPSSVGSVGKLMPLPDLLRRKSERICRLIAEASRCRGLAASIND